MKTSELIKRLQEIDQTVPFDADVVTGVDWRPCSVISVEHNPPHTFLEFEDDPADILEDGRDGNPFIGPEGHGAVSAEDRIDAVKRFTLPQCYDAMNVPGLQAVVWARLRARIRKLRVKERIEKSAGGAP